MTTALWRRVTSTRYIFILSGLVFVSWSLTGSFVPKSITLSALFQIGVDRNVTEAAIDQHSTKTTNTLQSQVTPQDSLPSARPGLGGLGIPYADVYVVSLANRQDRRDQMGHLRVAIQGLTWTVVDAIPANTTPVNRIIDWVAHQRAESKKLNTPYFRWPEDINALSDSRAPLKRSGSESWPEMSPPSKSDASSLPCAVENDSIPTFTNGTPEWMVLSPAKVACWHSHVSTIRQFVDGYDSRESGHMDDIAVILEDDIDMEKDISATLSQVWTFLPAGWDIVFLGHCWSDESYYPSLTAFTAANLHPSQYPKCTHAYALSLSGARRLLQHLRHPPFAYSRALDQAYAWLIRSGRLRSYSIVPSLIVQRKSAASDILPGSGSEWKEGLRNGVFQA